MVGVLYVYSPSIVSADLGPKPGVDIDVFYNNKNISNSDFSAVMLGCESKEYVQREVKYERKDLIPQLKINEYDQIKNCSWFPEGFAWGERCGDGACRVSLVPPVEFKLAVFIPSLDKVFITNEISRTNFNSKYRAELSSDGSAKILETTPLLAKDKIYLFIKSFIITIILELIVTIIFVSLLKLPKKIIVYVLFANIISLPIVWFLLPLIKLSSLMVIIISEFFAVIFETYFVYVLNKQIISLKQSLVLNILNNVSSLFVGGLILGFLSFFYI